MPQSPICTTGLNRSRWTDDSVPLGWSEGGPVGCLKDLARFGRSGFDWRAHEAELNSYPQLTTTIDEQTVHFLHVRSSEPVARPDRARLSHVAGGIF